MRVFTGRDYKLTSYDVNTTHQLSGLNEYRTCVRLASNKAIKSYSQALASALIQEEMFHWLPRQACVSDFTDFTFPSAYPTAIGIMHLALTRKLRITVSILNQPQLRAEFAQTHAVSCVLYTLLYGGPTN